MCSTQQSVWDLCGVYPLSLSFQSFYYGPFLLQVDGELRSLWSHFTEDRERRKSTVEFGLPSWRQGSIEWSGRFFSECSLWRLSISRCSFCCYCSYYAYHRGPGDWDMKVWREWVKKMPKGFPPFSVSFRSSLSCPWARARGFLLSLSLPVPYAHFWVLGCVEFRLGEKL